MQELNEYRYNLELSNAIKDSFTNSLLKKFFRCAVIDQREALTLLFNSPTTKDAEEIVKDFLIAYQESFLLSSMIIETPRLTTIQSNMLMISIVSLHDNHIDRCLKIFGCTSYVDTKAVFERIDFSQLISMCQNELNSIEREKFPEIRKDLIANSERELRKKVASYSLEEIRNQVTEVKNLEGNIFAPGNPSKATIVHWAARRGDSEIMDYIMELSLTALGDLRPHQRNVGNTQDKNGETPLHWACEEGHSGIIKILCQHLGDPTILNNSKKSPLHIFAEKNNLMGKKYFDLRDLNVFKNTSNTSLIGDNLDEILELLVGRYHIVYSIKNFSIDGPTYKTLILDAGEVSYSTFPIEEISTEENILKVN